MWASAFVSVVFFVLGVYFLVCTETVRSGAHLLIASAAVASFGFGAIMRRKERIGEITKEVLVMWQSRREELWKDERLSQILSMDQSALDAESKIRLTNYLYTIFDLLEYAIHLCSNGYFSPRKDVAHQYADLIGKILKMPHVAQIWLEEDFQAEYSQPLRDAVNLTIEGFEAGVAQR